MTSHAQEETPIGSSAELSRIHSLEEENRRLRLEVEKMKAILQAQQMHTVCGYSSDEFDFHVMHSRLMESFSFSDIFPLEIE